MNPSPQPKHRALLTDEYSSPHYVNALSFTVFICILEARDYTYQLSITVVAYRVSIFVTEEQWIQKKTPGVMGNKTLLSNPETQNTKHLTHYKSVSVI